MRCLLNANSVANAVRLSRQTKPSYAALIVEGGDDLKLFRGVADNSTCEIYPAEGRDQVIDVVAILKTDRISGVLGIIDADTDHLSNKANTHPDIVSPATRDIEGFLLRSPALEKVLIEHGYRPSWFAGNDIRRMLLSAAGPLGYLRWVASTKNWALDFKHLDFRKFVDPDSVACDKAKMCSEVVAKNVGFGVSSEELVREVNSVTDASHNPWHVMQGHDGVEILAMAISRRSRPVKRVEIQSDLRLAFEEAFFHASELRTAICNWQARNAPFVVLKSRCP